MWYVNHDRYTCEKKIDTKTISINDRLKVVLMSSSFLPHLCPIIQSTNSSHAKLNTIKCCINLGVWTLFLCFGFDLITYLCTPTPLFFVFSWQRCSLWINDVKAKMQTNQGVIGFLVFSVFVCLFCFGFFRFVLFVVCFIVSFTVGFLFYLLHSCSPEDKLELSLGQKRNLRICANIIPNICNWYKLIH